MKFPSLKNLAQSALVTIKRFPFEVLFALAGTVAANVFVQNRFTNDGGLYWRIIMSANLGLLLAFSATLFTESKSIIPALKTIFKVAACLLGIGTFLIINPQKEPLDYIRFFVLSICFHLLVSFAAFTSKGKIQGFWQFNKSLFLRFLTSILYSGVLFLGLIVALQAIRFLFGLSLGSNTNLILFIWIAGIFNTLFFLAGVPASINALNEDFSYPKGLKVFTQYVLIPLSTVYVLILLAYEVKILIEWNLPKGTVSNLIMGYSVFGILSILLVYPIREESENKWIKTYTKSFYFLLIPLLILLFLAVSRRVLPYGITIPRYYLVTLGFWLLFTTGYFLLSKKQNIKVIPISLCIVAFLSIYGPFNAFKISNYSQMQVLKKIFKKYNAVKDGYLIPIHNASLTSNDGNKAVEQLNYLVSSQGLEAVQAYIKKDLAHITDSLNGLRDSSDRKAPIARYELSAKKVRWVKNYLGLSKYTGLYWDGSEIGKEDNDLPKNFHVSVDHKYVTSVTGFDYSMELKDVYSDVFTDTIGNLKIKQDVTNKNIWVLTVNDKKVLFNLPELLNSAIKASGQKGEKVEDQSLTNYLLTEDQLTFNKEIPGYLIALKINNIEYNYYKTEGYSISGGLSASFLIKKK
ncbi:hypothetical protein ACVW0P_001890 [Mucilaginibacter sp. UYNi724]